MGNSSVEFCVLASDRAGNLNTSQSYSYNVRSLPTGDINGDGVTDMADISLAIDHFMQS